MTPTQTVTDSDNGGALSLTPGDTLAVQLQANPTTGYAWHTVLMPDGLFELSGSRYIADDQAPGMLGGGGVQELTFTMRGSTGGATMRGWLRLVLLRPFAPGMAGAKTWEILVTVG